MSDTYKKQVELLLKVLPEVAKEDKFALHGGTAINLFVRDMPRLSVDIDLTYIPIESRDVTLNKISVALNEIKTRLEKVMPKINIQHKQETGKLIISLQGVQIKIEVNLVSRGLLGTAEKQRLCKKTEEEYDAFTAIQVMPFGQLYGGKICAALDRQHPRDLFDIKLLLENEGLTQEARTGFLLLLISSDRPMHEILNPNLLDQKLTLENQFVGMTSESFSYVEFENTRNQLIERINKSLTQKDKDFLLSIKRLEPDWTIYDFEKFPAVRWKLQNLERLRENSLEKYQKQLDLLVACLGFSN